MGIVQLSTERMAFEELLKATAAEVEALIGELLPQDGGRLVSAMRYALLGEGKRLRPFLLAEAARLFDVPRERALRAGAALECMHCYSLIHDDLPAMDDDDLRRGKPTVHKAFDEATAILAGDALHSFAFEILSQPETHPDPFIRVELIAELARAAGKDGMAGGQMLDLTASTQVKPEIADVMRMQAMKTGALFRFACEAGAILGGASGQDRTSLRHYADKIGLAFQIADDILDIESSADRLGKATQKDKRAGKATYVDLLGRQGAGGKATELIESAKEAITRFGARARTLAGAADFMIQRTK
jgi:farnesyl diphosphate synthase